MDKPIFWIGVAITTMLLRLFSPRFKAKSLLLSIGVAFILTLTFLFVLLFLKGIGLLLIGEQPP